MSRYNTDNPIGSADPRDRDDNSKNLDVAINTTEDRWTDRLGNERVSLRAAVDPSGFAQSALNDANRAETQADRAETARDAAFVNADVYDDTEAGIDGTADGEQFQVVKGDEVVRYRNDNNLAVEVARFYTGSFGDVFDSVTDGYASTPPCRFFETSNKQEIIRYETLSRSVGWLDFEIDDYGGLAHLAQNSDGSGSEMLDGGPVGYSDQSPSLPANEIVRYPTSDGQEKAISISSFGKVFGGVAEGFAITPSGRYFEVFESEEVVRYVKVRDSIFPQWFRFSDDNYAGLSHLAQNSEASILVRFDGDPVGYSDRTPSMLIDHYSGLSHLLQNSAGAGRVLLDGDPVGYADQAMSSPIIEVMRYPTSEAVSGLVSGGAAGSDSGVRTVGQIGSSIPSRPDQNPWPPVLWFGWDDPSENMVEPYDVWFPVVEPVDPLTQDQFSGEALRIVRQTDSSIPSRPDQNPWPPVVWYGWKDPGENMLEPYDMWVPISDHS